MQMIGIVVMIVAFLATVFGDIGFAGHCLGIAALIVGWLLCYASQLDNKEN